MEQKAIVNASPDEQTFGEVVVPRSAVGLIIGGRCKWGLGATRTRSGKRGENIRKMTAESGALIQFKPDGACPSAPPHPPHPSEDPTSETRCALITGSRDKIEKATQLIKNLVERDSLRMAPAGTHEIARVPVPAGRAGLVIG